MGAQYREQEARRPLKARKLALVVLVVGAGAMIAFYAKSYFFPRVVHASPGELPENVRDAFAGAKTVELYSLDPSRDEMDGQGFHGWVVLGQITLEGAAGKAVLDAVEEGVEKSDGTAAKCFYPRHGIRVGSIDLVICFECFHVFVYHGWDRAFCTTTQDPGLLLNKILSDAGVPLPVQAEKK